MLQDLTTILLPQSFINGRALSQFFLDGNRLLNKVDTGSVLAAERVDSTSLILILSHGLGMCLLQFIDGAAEGLSTSTVDLIYLLFISILTLLMRVETHLELDQSCYFIGILFDHGDIFDTDGLLESAF